jgi:hypothetical protein
LEWFVTPSLNLLVGLEVKDMARLTATARLQGQPDDEKNIPSFISVNARSNYLQLSMPLILAQYRAGDMTEFLLVRAIASAFSGNLRPNFFHNNFGRVIPVGNLFLRHPAASPWVARTVWKHHIVNSMPWALEWSGVMCVYAHLQEGAQWRETWWHRRGGFLKDPSVGERDYKCCSGKRVPLLRYFGNLKTLNAKNCASMDLASLSADQRGAFNITDDMVSGKEQLNWLVRDTVALSYTGPEAEV